jgi:hypothetical protein
MVAETSAFIIRKDQINVTSATRSETNVGDEGGEW